MPSRKQWPRLFRARASRGAEAAKNAVLREEVQIRIIHLHSEDRTVHNDENARFTRVSWNADGLCARETTREMPGADLGGGPPASP